MSERRHRATETLDMVSRYRPLRQRTDRLHLVRDMGSSDYTGLFLLSAVVTVLVIRFFLWLTDYPQVGNDTLHIAHMLWGGLGMLIAIVMLLTFIGQQWKWMAAFIGGMGFGAFIDELGKFITSDNDYFFQPTIALIYIIFLVLYFVTRELQIRRRPSETEYLANAVLVLNQAATGSVSNAERQQALNYLKQCDPDDPLVRSLTQIVETIQPEQQFVLGPYYRIREWAVARYRRLVARRRFQQLLGAWFVFDALLSLIWVLGVATSPFDSTTHESGFTQWGVVVSTFISSIFIFLGLYALIRRSRMDAYRWYKYSLLVEILVTQIFMFAENQLAAISSLVANLLLLAAIQISISLEQTEELERPATSASTDVQHASASQ